MAVSGLQSVQGWRPRRMGSQDMSNIPSKESMIAPCPACGHAIPMDEMFPAQLEDFEKCAREYTQFHEWAMPQITQHGEDRLEVERLRKLIGKWVTYCDLSGTRRVSGDVRDNPVLQLLKDSRAALTHETQPRFANVSCSQCGRDFGPGEHGYSHCSDHETAMTSKEESCPHGQLRRRKCPICDAEDDLAEALKERDWAQDCLQRTHIALGGDGEWTGKLPPQEPPDSGDLHYDVPALAAERMAEIEQLREALKVCETHDYRALIEAVVHDAEVGRLQAALQSARPCVRNSLNRCELQIIAQKKAPRGAHDPLKYIEALETEANQLNQLLDAIDALRGNPETEPYDSAGRLRENWPVDAAGNPK
jgi:hypothetical protein